MPEVTFRTEFIDGALKVYENSEAYTDRLMIVQPFKPTSTGEQEPWADEAEALAWFESQKSFYGPADINVVEDTPPEGNE